jgi:L-lactate dehydrogenase
MAAEHPHIGIERIAIIGVGAVGATTAYALMQSGLASEILLYDQDLAKAEGEMMDLQHCLPFTEHVAMSIAELDAIRNCDLIVVAAGAPRSPDEPRESFVERSAQALESFMEPLARQNGRALFLIITNPVDIMTRVALRFSHLPTRQVVGSGTLLDTARFRTLISSHCKILPRHVHAYVVGEHGQNEVPVWSRAMIGPFHISEYCDMHGITLGPDETESINRDVREAASRIQQRKGATHFAIGLAAARLAHALSLNQDSVFTVSRRFEGMYRLQSVCLSMPTLVNREGAHKHFELDFSSTERDALMKGAEKVHKEYEKLGLGD